MPPFRALALLVLLIPSLPHLGDARRVKRIKGTPSPELGITIEGIPSSIPDEDRRRVEANLRRPSIPPGGYSFKDDHAQLARDLLATTPSRRATLGFATEWVLFTGGYTIGYPVYSTTRGNKQTRFNEGREIQHIPSKKDPVIAYTVYHAVPDPNKVIVFCHGNAANIEDVYSSARELANSLHAVVVGFEYPGYGDPATDQAKMTVGYATLDNVKFVTLAGVNWVRQVWGVDEKDIIMAGQSIGTGAATEVAWFYEKAGIPVAGLILISPYASVSALVKHHVSEAVPKIADMVTSLAVNATTFQTMEHLREMSQTPLFAIHAEDDAIIPFSQFENIQNAMDEGYRTSGKVEFAKIPKGIISLGHNFKDAQINDIFTLALFKNWIERNKECLVTPRGSLELRDIDLQKAASHRIKESVLEMVIPEPAVRPLPSCGLFCGTKK